VGGLLFALAQAQDPAVADAPTFAPGVLTTIEPEVRAADTVVTHDMMELRADVSLQHEPATNTESRTLYAMAEGVDFRREVWCLELSFKPLRMIEVDIPQPSGKMQRKLIWYLVYRVRNTGAGLTPMEEADGTFTTQAKATEEIRFVPEFVLASQDRNRAGQPVRKEYLDRVLPAALVAIQRREMPRGELLNSAQMSEQLLKAESGRQMGGLWGVAIWEDVDPQIDFFSVYVRGLTNAYDWQDAPADFRLGGPLGQGRRFTHKVLQLNFWRPGDAYEEDEREIRYGAAPKMAEFYGVAEGVAYQWVYR
jgi:hypothetical protein